MKVFVQDDGESAKDCPKRNIEYASPQKCGASSFKKVIGELLIHNYIEK
jgi:hypothetical protein